MKRHLGERLHLFTKGHQAWVFIQENILIENHLLSYLIKYTLLSIHGLFILFTLGFPVRKQYFTISRGPHSTP